jgi:hypothetical protein
MLKNSLARLPLTFVQCNSRSSFRHICHDHAKLQGFLYIDSSRPWLPYEEASAAAATQEHSSLYNVSSFVFLFERCALLRTSLSHPIQCFLEPKVLSYTFTWDEVPLAVVAKVFITPT